MQANLSPEQTQFVLAAVSAGKYQSAGHALDEAVKLLRRRDELLSMLQVGEAELDAGPGTPAADVFARLTKEAARLDREAGMDCA